jgi:hypothetical protein
MGVEVIYPRARLMSAFLCLLGGLAAVGVCAAEPMVAIPNNHPEINFAPSPAPSDMPLHMTLVFKIRNKAEWERVTKEEANPASPESRHQWTPQELHQHFGALPSDFHMVEEWLMQNGFTITLERYGKGPQDSVMFIGSVAQAEKSFNLKIVMNKGTPGTYSNTADPLVPARIASVVERIDGLDNLGVIFPLSFRATAQPDVTSFVPSNLYSTYNETPLSSAGINGLASGCIAIVALSDYSLAALAAFDSAYSLAAPTISNVYADGSDPNYTANETEALLDIEWTHAVAPSTPIKVFIGNVNVAGTGALVDAIQAAANDNTCGVISVSFDVCGVLNTYFTQKLNVPIQQAFASHQTVLVASDDFGSAGAVLSGGKCIAGTSQGVNEVATNPGAVAAGGTQSPPSDMVWDDSSGASGGGLSALFAQPSWQTGYGVPSGGNRDVPDMSMLSGAPGYYIYNDPTHNGSAALQAGWEGTSFSAPIWAGISQLIGQLLASPPTNGNGRISNFNSLLYVMGPQNLSIGFRDVTSGNNGFNGVTGFSATAGYDQATGWGVPDISKFVINFVSGNVLITGGTYNAFTGLATADLFKPAVNSFVPTGSMAHARWRHTQTLLDTGKTLVAGGLPVNTSNCVKTAELYDPASGTFSATGSMAVARCAHSATLLGDGTVLIAGGIFLKSAEIYNPVTGVFTKLTAQMTTTRSQQQAILLQDGTVLLIAGDAQGQTAEIYDPIAQTFTATGSMVEKRSFFTATLLNNGKVLVAGGYWGYGPSLQTAELYDPASGTFSEIGMGLMTTPRDCQGAVLLDNGNVLLAGGEDGPTLLGSGDLFNPATQTFSPSSGVMVTPTESFTPTFMPSTGTVLIAGGVVGGVLDTGEIYNPATDTFSAANGEMQNKREGYGIGASR